MAKGQKWPSPISYTFYQQAQNTLKAYMYTTKMPQNLQIPQLHSAIRLDLNSFLFI